MNIVQELDKPKVQWIIISQDECGQRLDNFLISKLKGVPKTRIYRIIRKGEVRVNKGRVDNKYRLAVGDKVRIPPIRVSAKSATIDLQPKLKWSLEHDILFEDEYLLVLNKPSGFAVHGGSGIQSGVIEGIRKLRSDAKFLELAHRLDKETSGCLIVAKKRSVLNALHDLFRKEGGVSKTYQALLHGRWERKKQIVSAPLKKNTGKGGERFVKVSRLGKEAETHFRRSQQYQQTTLVEASPITGRTHQIRVHAAWLGHPIIADNRYGEQDINLKYKKKGHTRLFLHASQLKFMHPVSQKEMTVFAPLPEDLQQLLKLEQA